MKVPVLWHGGLLAGALLCPGTSLQAQTDACALLKPADLTALLGGSPIAKSSTGGCTWSAAGSPKKLLAMSPRAAGPDATMAFMGARNAAAKGGTVTVTDEVGLGDKAFASLESFGVALVMLKQGRLLQLQYWAGAAGTAKDLNALRPVAKRAIAAF